MEGATMGRAGKLPVRVLVSSVTDSFEVGSEMEQRFRAMSGLLKGIVDASVRAARTPWDVESAARFGAGEIPPGAVRGLPALLMPAPRTYGAGRECFGTGS